MDFDQLIRFAVEQGASDVHLQTGAAPLAANQRSDQDGRRSAGRRPRPAPVHPLDQAWDDA